MGSTRLPGKVLRQAAGKPFLQHHIERLRRIEQADDVWVATTTLAQDDAIVDLCDRLAVSSFRGSEEDVLARYYGAALASGAESVVRVTSDCPLIDPEIVDRVIARLKNDPAQPDYVSNAVVRSYPRGLDCEAFRMETLEEAHRLAVRKEEREHVTPYIYFRPERFRILHEVSPVDLSRHRWTLDTHEDEQLLTRLLEAALAVNPEFRLTDLLRVIEAHPEWSEINAHIEQKAVHS
jgi:spore coat polysaccharide biosynthesis protein SpsF